MVIWLEKNAPIRRKFDALLAIFGMLGALNLIACGLVWQDSADAVFAFVIALATMIMSLATMLAAKALICNPYVETVVRMEALANGDLESPVRRTDHQDCVGRMTRAMATFCENAIAVRKASAEQSSKLIDTLSDAFNQLAQGDLTCRIDGISEGEYARLRDSFNTSVARIELLIGAVHATVKGVQTGSDEIRAASEDLALRNEQQAASLEETAASVGAVTSLTRKSAENAVSAKLAIEQTHARAGESGKGFAVVANEVRALAQRCAEAADEVKALITVSSGHVGSGVDLVNRSGEAFAAITHDVKTLSGAIQTIAQSAAQQAENLSQINTVVGELDRSTQQNAAMAEQCTAAATSLSQEANSLGHALSHFEIGQTSDIPATGSTLRRAA
ncbi:MAG: chemotaxis signal relay system methyl-accepting signal transducer [Porphyrobacter sp. HL-46]|nr:MAG: chemotaxis signal relay system methyl-accepting signal transducer [Porphyrobacter sp. HL-46]